MTNRFSPDQALLFLCLKRGVHLKPHTWEAAIRKIFLFLFSIFSWVDCVCVELHHINSTDTIPRHVQSDFNRTGLGRTSEWRFVYLYLRKPWHQTIWRSFYPKKCQVHYSNTIPNVFPEFLSFSKALMVNIQQPHLVFDQYNLNLSYSSFFFGVLVLWTWTKVFSS